MRNAFSGPKHDRYHIDPLELFKADREAANRGLAIAGIYHSHPDYPATLSKFDLEHSFPWYSYVVVSVPKGEAGDTRSWLPQPGPQRRRRGGDRDSRCGSRRHGSGKAMTVTIVIPTALRQHANDEVELRLNARTVSDALQELVTAFPNLRRQLYSESGRLRNFINIYLNEEDIRYKEGESTPLKDGDTLMIVPAVAGGAHASADDEEQGSRVSFSSGEFARYSRHLIMPEVGLEGQSKLKSASVLIIGAGGLGTPSATYLAAAGVGQDRDSRLRHHREEQPPPPGALLRGGRREEQGRNRQEEAPRDQPEHQRGGLQGEARLIQRPGHPRGTTTSSWTGRTTSRRATSSTTRASSWASPTSTRASSGSRGRPRSSAREKGLATVACIPNPRRLEWSRLVQRAASSASSRESWGASRPRRQSTS